VRRDHVQRAHACRLLIVDDEDANVRLLQRILARAGFANVVGISDPRQTVAAYHDESPDLVLLDLHMPHLDGFGVLEQLRELIPADTYVPILILTGDAAAESRQQALRLGARDFLTKPFEASEVVLRIENLLEARLLYLSLANQNQALEEKVHERTRQLEAALRGAEAASRAKSDFLARMSHELRTPLNSVIGFAKVLLKNKPGNLLPQDLAYLDRITRNGSHLLGLINDVLDISKVEAGKVEMRMDNIPLERVIYETLEQIEGRFVGSKVIPRISLPPVMLPVIGDEDCIRQILINLIGNAIKFTAEGRVTISVVADHESRPLRIDVRDTGIGIPEDRIEAVFESFEQADSDTKRRFGGTGLGLSISRALCDLMDYRLTLVSVVDRGSIFSILLRPEAVPPSRDSLLAPEPVTGPGRGKSLPVDLLLTGGTRH
jgi:two-component system, sensor histidine kinase and response regulator